MNELRFTLYFFRVKEKKKNFSNSWIIYKINQLTQLY